jgi:hypothetical protein
MIDHLKRTVDAADAGATHTLARDVVGVGLSFGVNCG